MVRSGTEKQPCKTRDEKITSVPEYPAEWLDSVKQVAFLIGSSRIPGESAGERGGYFRIARGTNGINFGLIGFSGTSGIACTTVCGGICGHIKAVCNGRGTCESHGACTCDVGFAGSLCEEAGACGSGDYNCNQSVDLLDFGAWESCMTGPAGGPYSEDCAPFDFNADQVIDVSDFAGFQRAFDRR